LKAQQQTLHKMLICQEVRYLTAISLAPRKTFLEVRLN